MYLRLFYTVLQEEIEALLEHEIRDALRGGSGDSSGDGGLADYAAVIVLRLKEALVQHGLAPHDLERVAMLGELSTSFLAETHWEGLFSGLGRSTALAIAAFIRNWLQGRPVLVIPRPGQPESPTSSELRSVLIPVDIPSISVVHTADIRLQEATSASATALSRTNDYGSAAAGNGLPLLFANQLVTATLHLKWTRIWDTAHLGAPRNDSSGGRNGSAGEEDLEFSYEVSAPGDTWLLGGRRKGHFVIPALSDLVGQSRGDHETERKEEGEEEEDELKKLSSGPGTEADVPLLLMPLREGWLPFPTVEIRAVRSGDLSSNSGSGDDGPGMGQGQGQAQAQHGLCETDCRNVGESLLVVADRGRVTVSLDASGPGGGPLVLESEGWVRGSGAGALVV